MWILPQRIWTFGDGNSETTFDFLDTSYRAIHTYQTLGSFHVELVVGPFLGHIAVWDASLE